MNFKIEGELSTKATFSQFVGDCLGQRGFLEKDRGFFKSEDGAAKVAVFDGRPHGCFTAISDGESNPRVFIYLNSQNVASESCSCLPFSSYMDGSTWYTHNIICCDRSSRSVHVRPHPPKNRKQNRKTQPME